MIGDLLRTVKIADLLVSVVTESALATCHLPPELPTLFVCNADGVGLDIGIQPTNFFRKNLCRNVRVSRHLFSDGLHRVGETREVLVEDEVEWSVFVADVTDVEGAVVVAFGCAARAERAVVFRALLVVAVRFAVEFLHGGHGSVGAVLETSVVLLLEHVEAKRVENLDLIMCNGEVDACLGDEAAFVDEGDDHVSVLGGNSQDGDARFLVVAAFDFSLQGLDSGKGGEETKLRNTSGVIEIRLVNERKLANINLASVDLASDVLGVTGVGVDNRDCFGVELVVVCFSEGEHFIVEFLRGKRDEAQTSLNVKTKRLVEIEVDALGDDWSVVVVINHVLNVSRIGDLTTDAIET